MNSVDSCMDGLYEMAHVSKQGLGTCKHAQMMDAHTADDGPYTMKICCCVAIGQACQYSAAGNAFQAVAAAREQLLTKVTQQICVSDTAAVRRYSGRFRGESDTCHTQHDASQLVPATAAVPQEEGEPVVGAEGFEDVRAVGDDVVEADDGVEDKPDRG